MTHNTDLREHGGTPSGPDAPAAGLGLGETAAIASPSTPRVADAAEAPGAADATADAASECTGTAGVPCTCEDATHGYTSQKNAYLARMRRIEGQVRGIERMIEQNKYCIDILTQVAAVTKALHSVSLGLVEDHLNHCVVGAARADEEAGRQRVKEATEAIARLWKS